MVKSSFPKAGTASIQGMNGWKTLLVTDATWKSRTWAGFSYTLLAVNMILKRRMKFIQNRLIINFHGLSALLTFRLLSFSSRALLTPEYQDIDWIRKGETESSPWKKAFTMIYTNQIRFPYLCLQSEVIKLDGQESSRQVIDQTSPSHILGQQKSRNHPINCDKRWWKKDPYLESEWMWAMF